MRGIRTSAALAAVICASSVAAETRFKEAACFWGNAQAMIEVAGDVCPHLKVRDIPRDTIENLRAIDKFAPCYAKGVAQMARTWPKTEQEIALFCGFAGTAHGFAGDAPIMERK